MFPMMQDPNVAVTMARHQIGERIRDADARRASRTARAVGTTPADAAPPRARFQWWTAVATRRSIA